MPLVTEDWRFSGKGMLERDRVMDVRTWVRDGGDAAGLVCLSIVR